MSWNDTKYFSVDESGNKNMIIVVRPTFDKKETEKNGIRFSRKKKDSDIKIDEHKFNFTVFNYMGRDYFDERVYAVCSLLVKSGIRPDDYVLIDAFGNEKRLQQLSYDFLKNKFRINVPKGNITCMVDGDIVIPAIYYADRIANQLFRMRRNNKTEYQKYEQLYKIDWQY